MNDSSACACTTLALTPSTLAALRGRYTGCLCLGCLLLLQQAESNRIDHSSP
jgi:hypothetical protein